MVENPFNSQAAAKPPIRHAYQSRAKRSRFFDGGRQAATTLAFTKK
jgi:hypothetical protein